MRIFFIIASSAKLDISSLYLHTDYLSCFCQVSPTITLYIWLCRNPIAVKRPNSAVKQQRKDSPGLQHRGAAQAGRGQANPKGIRDARGTKAKDDKVRLQLMINDY